MPKSFKVRVDQINASKVKLKVFIIFPDGTDFWDSKNFALQLIFDSARTLSNNCALTDSITEEQIADNYWLVNFDEDYIRSVTLENIQNFPFTENFILNLENPQQLPQADYSIEVTNPKWIAHLKEGSVWESAAYDAYDELC